MEDERMEDDDEEEENDGDRDDDYQREQEEDKETGRDRTRGRHNPAASRKQRKRGGRKYNGEDETENGTSNHQTKKKDLRRARSSPLHDRSKSLRGTASDRVLENDLVLDDRVRSEGRRGGGEKVTKIKKSSRRGSRQNVRKNESVVEEDEEEGGEEKVFSEEEEEEEEEDLLLMQAGAGDESVPGQGDQDTPPDEEVPTKSSARKRKTKEPSSQERVRTPREEEQARMIKALEDRLAIAEEMQRNTLDQMQLMMSQQKAREKREEETKAALEEKEKQKEQERKESEEKHEPRLTEEVKPLDMEAQAKEELPTAPDLNLSALNPVLSKEDERQEEEEKKKNMMEKDMEEKNKAIDESLVEIKNQLDSSMGRRDELRKTIEILTEQAISAHVMKLESAESKHREELQSMVDSKKIEEDELVDDAAEGRALSSEEKNEKVMEGSDVAAAASPASLLASPLLSLTPLQLSKIEEASEREREYLSQLDTARDAMRSMSNELKEAKERQQQETEEIKRMTLGAEKMHAEEVDSMRRKHRETILSLTSSSSSFSSSLPPPSSSTSTSLQEDHVVGQKEEEPTLKRSPSEAEMILRSLRSDMELHDEMSQRQLERLTTKLEETERIHAQQLDTMAMRHRSELERAAAGSSAVGMMSAITEFAATRGKNEETNRDDASEDGLMTTRRSALDLRQEAEEEQKTLDVVRGMKELADVARNEHIAEVLRLKEEHQLEIQRLQPSLRSKEEGGESGGERGDSVETLDLRREVAQLKTHLAEARLRMEEEPRQQLGRQPSQLSEGTARAAVLRPLVKGLHLSGLERGFRALDTERRRHLDMEQAEERRDLAGRSLHCFARRGARMLAKQALDMWKRETDVTARTIQEHASGLQG